METEHFPQPHGRKTSQPVPLVVTNPATEPEEQKINLGQPFAIVQRRLGIILGVAIALSLVTVPAVLMMTTRKPPKYVGAFQLLVEPVTAEAQYQRLVLNPQQNPEESANLQSAPTGLDYETQIQVLQSPKTLQPVVQRLRSQFPNLTYDRLVANLNIGRVTPKSRRSGATTKLLEVSYQDTDPKLTEAVLKQLSDTYLRYSLQERQTNISQGVKFIDAQLPKLRDRVDTLQRRLQAFRQRYTIVDPDLQGSQSTNQSGTLKQQQIDTETKLAETQARVNALQQQTARSNDVTVLAESPQYQLLLNKYQEIQSQIALEAARSREANPTLQALRDRERNLQALLRQEAQRVLGRASDDITILEARNRAIANAKQEVDRDIQAYPAIAREYADLQRELKVATNSLNEFLTKREALQIDVAQKEVPWELIVPPALARDATGEPVNLAAGSEGRYAVFAVFLSVAGGLLAGFLVDGRNNAYHTAKEISQSTRLPLLGLIPLQAGAEPDRPFLSLVPWFRSGRLQPDNRIPDSYSASFVEAMRSLYKNIRLLRHSVPIRSLVISSAEPGDGKSTIAANLAQAAAAMGQRVLLVDADLRHPQVHQQLGLPNQVGLSDIIVTGVPAREAIQAFPQRENLMVLTAGVATTDPLELLSSDRMAALMERFQMVFDLVIYDTPPLVGLADSSLIAARTDGLAMVIRLGKTRRSSIAHALEELRLSATPVVGAIANGTIETPNLYDRAYRRYYGTSPAPSPNGRNPDQLPSAH